MLRMTNAYMERLLRVAERDPIVAAAFGDVGDLLAPPQEIMRPRILWRVLRGNPRQRTGPGVRAVRPGGGEHRPVTVDPTTRGGRPL
jgi:hypothetical protein